MTPEDFDRITRMVDQAVKSITREFRDALQPAPAAADPVTALTRRVEHLEREARSLAGQLRTQASITELANTVATSERSRETNSLRRNPPAKPSSSMAASRWPSGSGCLRAAVTIARRSLTVTGSLAHDAL
jgi:hypothetical protein